MNAPAQLRTERELLQEEIERQRTYVEHAFPEMKSTFDAALRGIQRPDLEVAAKVCEEYAASMRARANPEQRAYAELPAIGADYCAKIIRALATGPAAQGPAERPTVAELKEILGRDGDPQGKCETTLTERYRLKDCGCGTYPDNLGPCKTWLGNGQGRCTYCDHGVNCHARIIGILHDRFTERPHVARGPERRMLGFPGGSYHVWAASPRAVSDRFHYRTGTDRRAGAKEQGEASPPATALEDTRNPNIRIPSPPAAAQGVEKPGWAEFDGKNPDPKALADEICRLLRSRYHETDPAAMRLLNFAETALRNSVATPAPAEDVRLAELREACAVICDQVSKNARLAGNHKAAGAAVMLARLIRDMPLPARQQEGEA